ncbi:MAG: hypothetical protein EAZ35_03205 [Sphingobacteriia bacterium]|nr:MAG: hypothetical protein EAZ35_03205 [Sphingobacteriia bacterium]
MSSQKANKDWLLQLYQTSRTVFRLADIALIIGELDPISLTKKIHYQVEKGNLGNPRKGLYTKPNFDFAALACSLYTPSYLSLEFVLQKEGIIFQYSNTVTALSYLSRSVEIVGREIKYRKLKAAILLNSTGIISSANGLNIATKERAFLDLLYLNGDTYFDSLNTINKDIVLELAPIYSSKKLLQNVKKLLGV